MIALTMRAAAVALLFGTSGSLAQQPARPAAPAAPAATAPTPSHLAAARELALILKIDEPVREYLDSIPSQLMSSFTTTRPELATDLRQVIIAMTPEIVAKREEMITNGVRIFAIRFTEPEIADVLKFFKTPIGEKYLRVQPQAFGEYVRELQLWRGSLNDFVLERIRAEMKKKGHDL